MFLLYPPFIQSLGFTDIYSFASTNVAFPRHAIFGWKKHLTNHHCQCCVKGISVLQLLYRVWLRLDYKSALPAATLIGPLKWHHRNCGPLRQNSICWCSALSFACTFLDRWVKLAEDDNDWGSWTLCSHLYRHRSGHPFLIHCLIR